MSRSSRHTTAPVSLFSFQDIITCLSGIAIILVLTLAIDVVCKKAAPAVARGAPTKDRAEQIQHLQEQIQHLEQALVSISTNLQMVDADALAVAQRVIAEENLAQQLTRQAAVLKARRTELLEQIAKVEEEHRAQQAEWRQLKDRVETLQAALAQAIEEKKVFFIPERSIAKTVYLVECSGKQIRVGSLASNATPRVFGTDAAGLEQWKDHVRQRSRTKEYFVFMIKPSSLAYNPLALVHWVQGLGFDVGYDALEEDMNVGFEGTP